MNAENLSTLSDAELVARLVELMREERRLTVAVLVHLGEVEARDIHLRAACSSMYTYCTSVLGMSADQAFKRIRAARALRRFPLLATAVADGRLHLSGILLLAAHLTDENVEHLMAEASGKSKAEIEILLARRAPRPDVPARIESVAQQIELAPGPVDQVGAEKEPAHRGKIVPLAPERFALQVTITEETRAKLMKAQALLRHQVPSGDLSELLELAADALLEKVEKKKFGRTCAPRKTKGSRGKRTVPNEVRREVAARDGLRCSFVSEDGRRCEETGFLELDHVVPVALGGEASDGIRILCRSPNQYEAARILGREVVDAGKAAKAMDDDLISGLRRLGVTASDARQAVAETRGEGPVEERLRAALAALRGVYAGRGRGTGCREPARETALGEPVDHARVEIGTLGASRAAAVARSDARGAWTARVPGGCFQVWFAERGSFRQIDGICGQAGETVVVPTAVLGRCTRTTRGMIRVGGILTAGVVVRAGNQRATTNALGWVSFACPYGPVSVAGYELEGSPFAFSTEDQVLVLDATPRAWIRGRVSLAGKPVGGVRVRVAHQRSDKPAALTVTSRDGSYEVAVAPGTHLVSAAGHGGLTTAGPDRPVTIAAGSPGARVDLDMHVPTSMEVVVPEGGARDLDLAVERSE